MLGNSWGKGKSSFCTLVYGPVSSSSYIKILPNLARDCISVAIGVIRNINFPKGVIEYYYKRIFSVLPV